LDVLEHKRWWAAKAGKEVYRNTVGGGVGVQSIEKPDLHLKHI